MVRAVFCALRGAPPDTRSPCTVTPGPALLAFVPVEADWSITPLSEMMRALTAVTLTCIACDMVRPCSPADGSTSPPAPTFSACDVVRVPATNARLPPGAPYDAARLAAVVVLDAITSSSAPLSCRTDGGTAI